MLDADLSVEQLLIRIDALLPQTQCRQCGYAGCRPYAEAIARGEAGIDQCPPGGAEGIAALAALLGCEPIPLNPAHGVEAPRQLALIDECACIGCTICVQACPVDAIIGAQKQMHTVIDDECTGCRLCIEPCPVDCITLVPAPRSPLSASQRAERSRRRYVARQRRSELEKAAAKQGAECRKSELRRPDGDAIARAIGRARARRQAMNPPANPSPSPDTPAEGIEEP